MYVPFAETYKATVKTDAIGVVANSRNISPNQGCGRHLSETEIELGLPRKVRQQIRSHWCKCGSFIPESADGLCAKCRKSLVEEYKASQQTPSKIGLAASLHAQGYEPHFNQIDCEAVMDTRCKLCAGACYYLGFKKGSSYRAISRCVKCGNEIEF